MSQKEHGNPLENPVLEYTETTRDSNWIYKNLSKFQIGATRGYKNFGRGAIVTEPHSGEESQNPSALNFGYIEERSIDDNDVKSHVQSYDPESEFIIVIKKPPQLTATGSEITSIYRVAVDLDAPDK